jgi:AraC-like DNA-binding protein
VPHVMPDVPFTDWDVVQKTVADAYFPHCMKPLSSEPASHSSLALVDLGPCRMIRLALGAPVALHTDHPGAYAINAPLIGSLVTKINGTTVKSEVGMATVCPPDTPARMPTYDRSCLVLGFRIEADFLEREYERVLARRPRPLPLQIDLSKEDGQSWMGLVRFAFDEVHGSTSGLMRDSQLTRQLSGLLVTGLLLVAEPDERSDRLGTRPRIVRKVSDALDENPAYEWTLAEMAELAGVSVRRLQQGFREYVGQTPFQYLNQLRLDRAHHDLVCADGNETVTEVALRWGFPHTGRFAANYRRKFGRTPSETLAR